MILGPGIGGASLVAQLVKNLPAMQETPVQLLGWGRSPWRRDRLPTPLFLGFPGGSAGKESVCNEGDLGLIPRLGNPLEKEKATHSSILAWRIPWTVEGSSSLLPVSQLTPCLPWVQSLGWKDFPGGGHDNPLHYSCLENPMDRGAWQATVHRVTKIGHYLATKPPPPTVPHRGKHLASLFHFLLVTQLFFNWRILLY